MSLEHPTPKNDPPNAVKNEAELGDVSATQAFSSQQGSPKYLAQHKGHPLHGPKRAIAENDQTVITHEPPLEMASTPLETGEMVPSGNPKQGAALIPPSGIQFSTGMMLGPFTVTKFIGGGGMGRVYLGFDKSLDRKVALKVLQRQRAQDQFSVARFMNEAKSAARLNHEHIAQVYFAGQQDDIPFIAFEFVEGTNIRSIVETHGAFPLPQAITYLIQIAHALDHAALHGVIHRDVKPSNILITNEGRAKLIDMGLARLLKPTDPGDDLTASGVTLGTFDYISPEQARDPRNADIRSDIYSLGCTFFFMLTGRPPFHEGTVLQKLLQHQGDEPPDIRHFLPGATPEVAHILQKMMAKDPRQRYQTPALLLTDLVNVAAKIGLRPSKHGKTVWTMRSSPKRSLILAHIPWISGFVLFLTALACLNWLWPAKELQPPPVPPTRFGGETPGSGNGPVVPDPPPPPRQEWTLYYWNQNLSPADSKGSLTLSTSSPFCSGVGVRFVGETLALQAYATNKEPSMSLAATFPARTVDSDNNQQTDHAILIVDPYNFQSQEGVYSNIGAAISAAGKDATIELRYTGNANMKMEPMSLVGKQLTIQAGKGFSPTVQFKPSDSSVVKEGRTFLFLLNGGNLRFQGIAFEMEVSSLVLAEKWSLFDILGPSSLLLSDCSITIRNTQQWSQDVFHEWVSVFRIAGGTGSESTSSPAVSPSLRPPGTGPRWSPGDIPFPESEGIIGGSVSSIVGDPERSDGERGQPAANQIVLNNCIIRGETTVLSVEAKRPVRLEVNNAFFATDLPFAHFREIPGPVRERDQKVNISMQHVSLYCKSKLNRFVKKENSYPLSVKWSVTSSVFRLHKTPINEFFGFLTQEELQPEYSEWEGEHVFFQDVTSFAEIKASTSVNYPTRLSWEEWRNRWSSPPTINVNVLLLPLPENRTVNRMYPTDMAISQQGPAYQVAPHTENDAQIKINAGQIFELLPEL